MATVVFLVFDGHVEVDICGVAAGGNVAARTRSDFQRRPCEGAVAFQPACCSLAFEVRGPTPLRLARISSPRS